MPMPEPISDLIADMPWTWLLDQAGVEPRGVITIKATDGRIARVSPCQAFGVARSGHVNGFRVEVVSPLTGPIDTQVLSFQAHGLDACMGTDQRNGAMIATWREGDNHSGARYEPQPGDMAALVDAVEHYLTLMDMSPTTGQEA